MKKMKSWKKHVILAMGILFTSIFATGKITLVSAAETITASYLEANGSTVNVSTHQFQKTAGTKMISIPIKIPNAGRVGVEVTPAGSSLKVDAALSDNSGYVNWAVSDWFDMEMPSDGEKVTLSAYAKGACTWYLHIAAYKEDIDQELTFTVKAYQRGLAAGVKPGSGELERGKWASFCLDREEISYYKINVPSSGRIQFEASYTKGLEPKINLLNEKKKSLTEVINKTVSYFYVKKGTYYISVENYSPLSLNKNEEIFQMRYTFKKIKAAKNTKRSKGVVLKKGKKLKNRMMFTGKSDCWNWYKLKLTKDQTVKFNISMECMYMPVSILVIQTDGQCQKVINVKKAKCLKKLKLKKGTYDVEVVGSLHGCLYSIQWK